jgi:hypothetical protein
MLGQMVFVFEVTHDLDRLRSQQLRAIQVTGISLDFGHLQRAPGEDVLKTVLLANLIRLFQTSNRFAWIQRSCSCPCDDQELSQCHKVVLFPSAHQRFFENALGFRVPVQRKECASFTLVGKKRKSDIRHQISRS